MIYINIYTLKEVLIEDASFFNSQFHYRFLCSSLIYFPKTEQKLKNIDTDYFFPVAVSLTAHQHAQKS